MKDGWKHLYGVIGTSENLNIGPIKVENQSGEVYPIIYKELSAIVSNTSFVDYKKMTKDIVVRDLLKHQKVIESVMGSYPIISFKFGSLAHTEEEVTQILIRGYDLFKFLLPWVGERVELELVATWDREKIFKALYEEESEIQSLQKKIGTKSEEDAFLEKIKLGELVRQCLLKKKVSSRKQILSQLRECTESYCDHDVMDDIMILNTAFLLRKEMEKEFDNRVQYLDDEFLGKISFKVIGPLPLYSFGCIEVEWTSVSETREALALLGLNENASSADVRNAYYQKAKSLHPDKMRDLLNSPPKFEKLAEAYKFLRKYYNQHRSFPREDRILLMEVRTNGSNY
ncbi:MAG: GvpL/GvpF family gas vesicle protein [Thermodesulfobacteriota bacterium]|nr:GvpL/GvpF family gas vesicle protein [Thermodesulfobacteriota bacterium]